MNLEELKTKHADIYRAAFDEGKAAGIVEGVDTGKKAGYDAGKSEGLIEGAQAEQKRIKEVEAALIPGHEALIESLKADGKTTGAEAMTAVIAAERRVREAEQAKLNKDNVSPAAAAAAPSQDAEAAAVAAAAAAATLSVEERAKEDWDKKPEIRSEFKNIGAYTAYLKNVEGGRVKIYGKR